ncbi:unnamed protein product, partial [Cylicostephanus goldi]
ETDFCERNEDEGNDSIEVYDESQGIDDDSGDCEIVNDEEIMETSGYRYFVPSDKVTKTLDMLADAECHSNFDALIRLVVPSTRDATRAAVLAFFALSTTLLFLTNPNQPEMDVDRSNEVFAPGLQSREDFGRADTPLMRRRRYNFTEKFLCKGWQVPALSTTPPSWLKMDPIGLPPLFPPTNANLTPAVEVKSC